MAKIKASHGANDSLFRETLTSYIGKDSEITDIITSAESSWGLNLKLKPVQKFMLKAFYGLPLDDHLAHAPLQLVDAPPEPSVLRGDGLQVREEDPNHRRRLVSIFQVSTRRRP